MTPEKALALAVRAWQWFLPEERTQVVYCVAAAVVLMVVYRTWPVFYRSVVSRARSLGSMSPGRAVAVAIALPLSLRLLTLPATIPSPGAHDEFSYLLAADTFAHGRITNPAHPLWESFESFHILQRPTYMSMYPPAQGAALAVGQRLFGHPWWGVFLTFGILCGLLYWAMLPWLPRAWSLLAAILAGVPLGADYWLNSYWGGAPAAIGGALVVGAVGRLVHRRRAASAATSGLILGLGAAILANSRPWEGLWLVCGSAILLANSWLRAHRSDSRRAIASALPACAAVLLLTAIGIGYYCERITGSPLQFPYTFNRAAYAVAPLFLWQKPAPAPQYRNPEMRRFYLDWEPSYQNSGNYATLRGFAEGAARHALIAGRTLFGILFVPLVLLFLWPLLAARNGRMLVAWLAIGGLALALQRYVLPDYLAPMLPLAIAVKTICLRRLFCLRWRQTSIGWALAPAFAAAILLAALPGYGLTRLLGAPAPIIPGLRSERPAIVRRLEGTPGRHLVLVRYSADHDVHIEWVYNAASIDQAKVVWARELGGEQDRRLLEYFADRTVWVLEADTSPPALRPARAAAGVLDAPR